MMAVAALLPAPCFMQAPPTASAPSRSCAPRRLPKERTREAPARQGDGVLAGLRAGGEVAALATDRRPGEHPQAAAALAAGILAAAAVARRQNRKRRQTSRGLLCQRDAANVSEVVEAVLVAEVAAVVTTAAPLGAASQGAEGASRAVGVAGAADHASVARLPWLQRHLPERKQRGPRQAAEELLLSFMEAVEERGIELYPAQEEAIVEIFGGAHVVLDTPTGSGKSLVAVAALFRAAGQGRRAYYTCPTKALVSEKFFDLCRHFGPELVGMATGDVAVNTRACLVCCTAEVLTSIALRDGPSANMDCVVMDEFHYYGTGRGSAWEIPLWRMPHVSFVLMSGTLGDNRGLYDAIAAFSGRPLRLVSSYQRPVPLEFTYSPCTAAATLEGLVRDVKAPVYAVHFSQREALLTAQELAAKPALAPPEDRRVALQRAVGGADFGSPFGEELRRLLLLGVGVHHAGLLPRYRRLVEQLAQAGLLTLICGTDTLGVGINVPIRSVVFTRLCKFDGEDTDILGARDFQQIAGRSGRRGFDTKGYVVALDPDWISYNRELQEEIKKGSNASPRWRRPPRNNYKHWTRKTFERLQRLSPKPLRSQFQLSMGQVLGLLQGAREHGRDGRAELRDLIECAQCSRGERRFWHRQVEAYVAALQSSGFALKEAPAAVETTANRTAGELAGAPDSAPASAQNAFVPTDSASLFLAEAVPLLAERLAAPEEELAMAALVAAEAVCEQPSRRPGPKDFGQCPEVFEDLLYECFAAFRRRSPWVSEGEFQPKGIAFELVAGDLSFAALASRLSDSVPEGALLRYLADVYRTLRCGVPPAYRRSNAGLREVEQRLRSAVAAADPGLLREWEALRAVGEDGAADMTTAGAGADTDAGKQPMGGTMVPGGGEPGQRRRSRAELEARVLEVRTSGAARRQEDEKQAARWGGRGGLAARALRLGSRLQGIFGRLWGAACDALW